MLGYGIGILCGGALLLVFAILLCFGHVGLLHEYHRENVSEEDYKKYGLLLGLSLMVGSLGMISGGIIAIVVNDTSVLLLSILLFVISLVISIIAVLLIIKKFNGNIFG